MTISCACAILMCANICQIYMWCKKYKQIKQNNDTRCEANLGKKKEEAKRNGVKEKMMDVGEQTELHSLSLPGIVTPVSR